MICIDVAGVSSLKPIPGHEGYAATDDGQIWSENLGRFLAQCVDRQGYMRVGVRLPGKKKRLVHTLVIAAFHGPKPSPLHQSCHLNGIRSDNRSENLRWGTSKDNAADRERHGNTAKGMRGGRTKLTPEQVACIRAEYATGEVRQVDLAAKYGVNNGYVSRLVAGKSRVSE